MTGGRKSDDKGIVAAEQLTLADEDERLPWLESGDDDEDSDGVDTGRILVFVLFALAALAALVGVIWWFGHRGPDRELIADGSTIEAPEGPYKVRPSDPGGKTFEGTGNIAPAVGEGQTREGRIADAAPQPSIDAPRADEAPAPSASSTASATATAAAPSASGGVAVQVGAYSSKAAAEAGWQRLQGQTEKLNGVSHRVIEGQADIGTVYRLQAMAGDAASASRLCSALKSDGVACQVKN